MEEQDTFPIDDELFGESSFEDMVEESEKASLPPEEMPGLRRSAKDD